MEGWTERITGILGGAPTGARPYAHLLQALRDKGPDPTGREALILQQMTEQPERFRVIPDRLGPWSGSPVSTRLLNRRFEGPFPIGDPWILSRSPNLPIHGYEERVMGQIRESLKAWGQEVDTGPRGRLLDGSLRTRRLKGLSDDSSTGERQTPE